MTDRILSIGTRQLESLRLLWECGPATVTQLHAWLHADPPIAYTTVQTACVSLTTKGVLIRSLREQAYVYEPAIGPATFTQVMVRRTGRMLAPYVAEQVAAAPHNESQELALEEQDIAALSMRVATAEQSAMQWEAAAYRGPRATHQGRRAARRQG